MSIFRAIIAITLVFFSRPSDAKNVLGNAELVSLKSTKTLKASDLSGKVVVLDFWATWCESCRKNLTVMDDLLKVQKSNARFVFVGMDEEGPDAIRSFFALPEMKTSIAQVKSLTYWDKNQNLGNRLAKNGIPYIVAFNQKGKVIFEHDGILNQADLKHLKSVIAKEEGR